MEKEQSLVLRFNSLPDDKISGLPKLKALADYKSYITRNIKVVFHRIENIVGKEENAGYHNVFKRLFPPVRQKSSLCGNGLTFATQSRLLPTLRKKPFEKFVGKGENACNQHFLLFPQCFLPFPAQISLFNSLLFCCLQILKRSSASTLYLADTCNGF